MTDDGYRAPTAVTIVSAVYNYGIQAYRQLTCVADFTVIDSRLRRLHRQWRYDTAESDR